MGKVPIRLREVVYTLSPFEQTVMNGVFKDVPEKLHRKFSENWVDVGVFFIAPVAATFAYANNFLEKEKMHHRH